MVKERKQSFANSSVILFFIMMVGNAFNYFFQIVMGRLLSTAEYGTLNTLLSVLTVAGTPSLIIASVSAAFTTKHIARGEQDKLSAVFHYTLKLATACAAAIFLVGFIFSGFFCSLLDIECTPLLIAILAAAVTCITPAFSGALQGAKRFAEYGLQGDIVAFVKLAGGVVLVLCGIRVVGPVLSSACGSVAALLFSAYCLRGAHIFEPGGSLDAAEISEIKRFASKAMLIQIISTVLQNGDVLIIKAYTSAEQAGVYSSGAVIAKIALYVSGAVTAVLYPLVGEASERREDTRPLLSRALLYGAGPAVLYCIVLNLFGNKLIGLFFGERYLAAADLLLPTCALVLSVTLLVIELNYFLALNRTHLFAATVLFGCAVIVVLVSVLQPPVPQMLYTMSSVLALVFLVNLLAAYKRKDAAA
ncbi:MAG: oligosaccharide flippase family protein [Oscillospiraceae bacterium]|nr:oligosaccharide flippase family protein [Oscillospiraceae bacterium]